jgi:hypothetical protein
MTQTDRTNPSRPTPSPALLDFPATQSYLGNISRSTLKLLVWRGLLKPTRIGRRVLFSRRVLDNYIQRQTGDAENRVDCA